MSARSLGIALARPRRELPTLTPDDCNRREIGLVLCYCPEPGDPEPTPGEADIAEAKPCPQCGGMHALVSIEEIIIVPGYGEGGSRVRGLS